MKTEITDKIRYEERKPKMYHKGTDMVRAYMNDLLVRGYDSDYITPYKTQYFTLEALGIGQLGFESLSQNVANTDVVETPSTYFYYSLDNGANWIAAGTQTFYVNVNAGDKILFKRNSNYWRCARVDKFESLGSSSDWWWANRTHVYATCEYKVYGNIMSLWYGDNFIGKTTIGSIPSSEWRGICMGMFAERANGYAIILRGTGPVPNVCNGEQVHIESSADGDGHIDHYLIDAGCLYIPFDIKASKYTYTSGGVQKSFYPSYTFAGMFFNCQKLIHAPYIEDPTFVGYRDFQETFAYCYSLKDAVYRFDCYFDNKSSYYTDNFLNMFIFCYHLEKGPTLIRSWGTEDSIRRNNTDIRYGALYYDMSMFSNCQMLKTAPAIFYFGNNSLLLSRITIENNWYTYDGMYCQCFSLKEMAIFYMNYNKYNIPQTYTLRDGSGSGNEEIVGIDDIATVQFPVISPSPINDHITCYTNVVIYDTGNDETFRANQIIRPLSQIPGVPGEL